MCAKHLKLKMAAESAKWKRSAAKGRLTRTTNALNEYISGDSKEYELLNSIFSDVENAWHNLEQKHDEFISVVENPEDADHDEWMNKCQTEFYNARKSYYTCRKEVGNGDKLKTLTKSRDVKYDSLLHSFKNIEDLVGLKCA